MECLFVYTQLLGTIGLFLWVYGIQKLEGFNSTGSPCIGKEVSETQKFDIKQIDPCQLIWFTLISNFKPFISSLARMNEYSNTDIE